jgi:dethiobiotin synthetase
MPRSLYITGTDTGVGKTLASTALLHRLRAEGVSAIGMKPVASGCTHTPEGWRNEDALALIAASKPTPDYALVNPFALPLATAPQLAARAAGVAVTLAPIRAAYAALAAQADTVVIEGAGGWLAPFADDAGQGYFEQAEIARMAGAAVVLVVGLRLGCLSHARLTARAIAADGLTLAGWIGSAVDPDFAERQDYLGLLAAALPAPCLGVLDHRPVPDPVAWAAGLRLP